jgi:hypothetical protein
MKIIDVTLDLETLSLAANAAVLQVAAVAADRYAEAPLSIFPHDIVPFEAKVDLRSCAMEGFDFDNETLKWWADKPKALRDVMASGDCYPIDEVFQQFSTWIGEVKQYTGADDIMLWAQGSDMDIAILRHVFRHFNMELPCKYWNFRDARTFIIEVVNSIHYPASNAGLEDHKKVYDVLPQMPENAAFGGEAHNAIYDAARTAWNVCHVFKLLKEMAARPVS